MSSSLALKKVLIKTAKTQGFDGLGIAPATPVPKIHAQHFGQWLADGWHAEMEYMTRNIEKRFDASLLMPGAQSVIILAKAYGNAPIASHNKSGISLYAWGEDYHLHLCKSGQPLMDLLKAHDPGAGIRFFADTAPLSERSYAVMAGVGSIGKNGTLITESHGSMVWLSAIVTTIALPPDTPATEDCCGSCSLCIRACPTGAIGTSGRINANRCIAYHTNSSKKPIPDEIIGKLNGQIFGCDICQQVCPWNDSPNSNFINEFQLAGFPAHWPKTPNDWIDKDEQWFRETFAGSTLTGSSFSRMSYQSRLVCQSIDCSSAQPDEVK
jgi:epoxyqueuosine reductase